ncbi:MAG: DegT/DnrJ/EryC1/StrS family aminotransferase [Nitrospirales bacterium]|nr:DegT/DnrJ/EryC1/StrS family aminotransferase [Nitrospira sp.]MDR4500157.1 DegT/DnrJ/EryC1/StrS family aminotransferase [Nitrospirales bacterium]
MKVPLLDLKLQFQPIRRELLGTIEEVCDDQGFVLGPRVEQFEQVLGKYVGTGHAVGVASGSDALLLSLVALDVRPGDEVITVPFTFFSTAGVISRLGATPVFVDIQATSFNLDADQLVAKITSRTKAIIPVHLFGQCAEMEKISAVAAEYDIPVIEDACQAIGAARNGVRAGGFGTTGCFSFFPSKNLGGFGDGGIVTTHDEKIADRLRALRVHGSRSDYHHHLIGMNSRLDALQAAVLQSKLPYLDEWTEKRRSNAQEYARLFQEAGLLDRVTLPVAATSNYHVFNQYTIRTTQRDQLSAYLTKQGIGNKIYYPVPLHLQECYQVLGYEKGQFPVSEQTAHEVLSLPIYPELSSEQLSYVVRMIKEFFEISDTN